MIGLWLNDSTEGATIDEDGPPDNLRDIDIGTYEVVDLKPDPAGYIFVRGVTWAPGVGKRPYP